MSAESRRTRIILALVIAALAIATFVLAQLNIQGTRQITESTDEYFEIIVANDPTASPIQVWRSDIEEIGLREFSVVMNTSTGLSEQMVCEGVSLKKLLDHRGIPFSRDNAVVVVGEDGYHARYTGLEIESEAIYVVINVAGEPLTSRRNGGMGPFMTVVRREQFAQRWCKYLIEMRVE
ncbi:MAG: hypothetical protein FWD41_01130 [Actinomycetia bacterium]|nr:hypothetical protein [Actinomycetes bacterium]